MKENKESDGYGNVTFGEASRLLVDIIGQNVILGYISKDIKDEKEAENKRDAFRQKLDRMYKGQAVYRKFATAEPESPQLYIAQFFVDVLEKKYGLSHLAYIIIDSFTWQLFFALTHYTPFEKPKKETAFFLIRKEIFNFIYHVFLKGEPLSDDSVFRMSGDSIKTFLTDSYDKIFSEINEKIISNDSFPASKKKGLELLLNKIFENKKTLHGKIENFYDDHADKYPRLDSSENRSPNYRQNIFNWSKENNDTRWTTLEPIFDFLCDNGETSLVHRLIGLYLLKNTQRAMEEILGISEEIEQKQIIEDIKTMINENKEPEEFYIENDFEFLEQISLIYMCLVHQHQQDFDIEKSNEIIKAIEDKCENSKKFFSPWLKAREKIFEKGETLKENEAEQNKIIEGYKQAYDEGVAYAGAYLAQFFLEAIVINISFKPGSENNKNDNFFGYGYALEIFGDEKQKLLDNIKEYKNTELRRVFIDILNKHNPLANIINNKGLEFEKTGNFELAIQCFSEAIMLNSVYINAYSNRGNVYNKMGEHYIENALTDFNMALWLDPKHKNTIFNRGLLFLENGQYENAITDFTNLININPEDEGAYSSRGKCYYYTKNFNFSIKDCNKAIEINPYYAEAYYIRSIVHRLMGNDDKAQEDLRKALEINPKPYLEGIFNKGFYYDFFSER